MYHIKKNRNNKQPFFENDEDFAQSSNATPPKDVIQKKGDVVF